MNEQHAFPEESPGRHGKVLLDGHVVNELRRGEVVVHLPKNMGQENQGRKRATHPQPLVEKMPSRRRKRQADDQPQAEESHRVLVFQAQARHQAKQHPQPGVAALQDAHQKINAQGPEQVIKAVHRVIIGDGEINARRRCTPSRPAPAQIARHPIRRAIRPTRKATNPPHTAGKSRSANSE